MTLIHWPDLLIIAAVTLAILLPDLLKGFETWKVVARIGILAACSVLAMLLSHFFQPGVDPAVQFVRTFSIGLSTMILFTLIHIAQLLLSQAKGDNNGKPKQAP